MPGDWYKCSPGDLLEAMAALADPALIAVYVAAINRIYQADGPIANDASYLGVLSGLSARKARVSIDRLIELDKLYLVDGKLMNARCATELGRRDEVSKARSQAGKTGGKVTSSERSQHVADASPTRSQLEKSPQLALGTGDNPSGMAENSHPSQAIASPRAPARALDQTREEKSPPQTPPKLWSGFDEAKPDFDQPLDDDARLAAIEATNLADRRDGRGHGYDIGDLTSRIMMEAKMAVPPVDLALVEGWVRMGMVPDLDIMPVVARLSANARTPVRGMRYFDAELRRIWDAKAASSSANILDFERIARKAQR